MQYPRQEIPVHNKRIESRSSLTRRKIQKLQPYDGSLSFYLRGYHQFHN